MFVVLETIKQENFCHAAFTKGYEFIQETATILNHTKYGLASTHWSGVSSSLTCASMVVNSCPGSRGYIFEPVSGLCTPLNWLHEGPSPNFGIPAGELYLTTDHLCPDPFKIVQSKSDRQVACFLRISPSTSYGGGTNKCVDLGGYLATVKTAEKLAMVVEIAQGANLWVGMDDKDKEGRYVWQEDKSVLTQEVKDAVFNPGEPNNGWNVEDCVHYRGSKGRLNDQHCWAKINALCEIPLIQSQC
ncbi:hypothetical protein RRG08_018258 [Elysia crispata]|uniref:C-type lectin domain-containing protein n=1 Tax=Elysia crispata TaxID=231223 RepID=A0AAE1AXX2_9GAST|nr:hypothetical protein RRG08_018258 [Elysia crispata]